MFCEALLPGHAPAGAAGQQKVGNTLLLPKIWFSGLISLMKLVFSAGSRGLWEQTKSAVALWTPSPADTHVTGLYRGLGTKGRPSKFASVKTNKLRWGCEAVQRATAKPSGRARRREPPAQHAHILWKKAQLNRAEGSRGNAPWKICKSPLQKGENAAIMNGNAQGWGRRRTSLGKRAGEGVSPVKTA